MSVKTTPSDRGRMSRLRARVREAIVSSRGVFGASRENLGLIALHPDELQLYLDAIDHVVDDAGRLPDALETIEVLTLEVSQAQGRKKK